MKLTYKEYNRILALREIKNVSMWFHYHCCLCVNCGGGTDAMEPSSYVPVNHTYKLCKLHLLIKENEENTNKTTTTELHVHQK